MRTDMLEIYSDATNAAVIRHPNRKFPGVLLQGDTLYGLFRRTEEILLASKGRLESDEAEELQDLRDHLAELVSHYKRVLLEHNMPLPFFEKPDA